MKNLACSFLWVMILLGCSPSHTPAPASGEGVATRKLTPDWPALQSGLFRPKCAICHNPNGSARFVDLSSVEAVRALPDPGLLLAVMRDAVEPMPPIWSNLERVSEDDIQVVERWIELGLP